MKTSKPFSTISYNSVEFLITKLDDLVNRRKLAFYSFVEHIAEEDELKAHKHLFCIPNGQINTDEILDYLVEIDITKPDKPLRCMPCKSSKFRDWYLYSCHDVDYLATKGQTRKYHYLRADFIVSDSDYFNEEIHSMDLSAFTKVKMLREASDKNVPFEQLLINGQIPIQQVYAYRVAYELMSNHNHTNRNGRQSHQRVNVDTGEIISDDII